MFFFGWFSSSIQVGAVLGASSLWSKNYCFLLNHLKVYYYCFAIVIVMFKKIVQRIEMKKKNEKNEKNTKLK